MGGCSRSPEGPAIGLPKNRRQLKSRQSGPSTSSFNGLRREGYFPAIINNKPEEITSLLERETEPAAVISNSRVRLDAVRLIWKASPNWEMPAVNILT